MFCTLKTVNVAGEPYMFEATEAPFLRKREGKMSKVACTNCRVTKLRCSGESMGCRRCLNKKLECQYPYPPRSNSQKKVSQVEQSPQEQQQQQDLESPPANIPTQTGFNFSSESTSSSSSVSGSSTDSISTPIDILQDMSHRSSPILHLDLNAPSLSMPDELDPFLLDGLTVDPSNTEGFWQGCRMNSTDNGDVSWAGLLELEDMGFSTTGTASLPKPSTPSGCRCLSQLAVTHEAIEMFTWGQKDHANNVHDILHQQKKALADSEELLDCPNCCSNSYFVMLLLSMCRKLLETLDAVRQCAMDGYEDLEVGLSRKRRKSGSDRCGIDESRRGNSISISKHCLDNDDEQIVVQGLVMARVKILARILTRLTVTISQNNWPVHKGLARELQNTLYTGYYAISR